MSEWITIVKQARASGMTLQAIADRIGAESAGTVCDIEKGRVANPSFKVGSGLKRLERNLLRKRQTR